MATGLTPGCIYFIESDSGDNSDWITDHSGDPDLIDFDTDNFTEGTEYCKLLIPETFRQRLNSGIVTTASGGAKSFSIMNEKRWYQVLAGGIETTRANAKLVHDFFAAPRHTSGDKTNVYVDYYLIIYFGTNDHIPFMNASGVSKSYCPVDYSWVDILWSNTRNTLTKITIQVTSVW